MKGIIKQPGKRSSAFAKSHQDVGFISPSFSKDLLMRSLFFLTKSIT
jgi:hypothetical protein